MRRLGVILILFMVCFGLWACNSSRESYLEKQYDEKLQSAYSFINNKQWVHSERILRELVRDYPEKSEPKTALASVLAAESGLNLTDFYDFARSLSESLSNEREDFSFTQSVSRTNTVDFTEAQIWQILLFIHFVEKQLSLLPAVPSQQTKQLLEAIQVLESLDARTPGAIVYRAALKAVYLKSKLSFHVCQNLESFKIEPFKDLLDGMQAIAADFLVLYPSSDIGLNQIVYLSDSITSELQLHPEKYKQVTRLIQVVLKESQLCL